jgi:hypothetical protein
METEHTETVVEKVTSYVKDMLGIHTETPPVAEPEYDSEPHETAPEVTAENAMRLNPNPYALEELDAQTFFPPVENPTREVAEDILPTEVNEHALSKSAMELNEGSARAPRRD